MRGMRFVAVVGIVAALTAIGCKREAPSSDGAAASEAEAGVSGSASAADAFTGETAAGEERGWLDRALTSAGEAVDRARELGEETLDVAREKLGEFKEWVKGHACDALRLAATGGATAYFVYAVVTTGGFSVDVALAALPALRELWDVIRSESEDQAVRTIDARRPDVGLLLQALITGQCSAPAAASDGG